MKPSQKPGEFARAELATTEARGAKAFYGALLGLETQAEPAAYGMAYDHLELAGGRGCVGGLYELATDARKQGIPPHWTGAVTVSDLDAAVACAAELGGGVIQPPFAAFDEGRLALIRDPTGAALQLFEPAAGARAPGDPINSGMFSWHELATGDLDRAAAFLAALFGWRRVDEARGEGPESAGLRYAVMMRGEEAVCGLMALSERWRGRIPAHWVTYFTVEDAAKSAAFAVAQGARVLMPAADVRGVGAFAVLNDPQGAAFGLFSPRRDVRTKV